jgi:hypothetical protein
VQVSVVIVSYNTRELLRRCLNSLTDSAIGEIIVVDNSSKDGSTEMVASDFPGVVLIQSGLNLGYGAANNRGSALAKHELVLFLNPDCAVNEGAIAKMAREFSQPQVVAVGGQLYNEGGNQPCACCELTLWTVFCEQTMLEKIPGFHPYWLPNLPQGGSREVEQVMGASLMVRGKPEFDERFFLYCEDTELCKRLRSRGRIVQVDARILHALGASSEGENRWWSIAMYNRGKELYFFIHHGKLSSIICLLMNRFGALIRMVAHALALRKIKVKMFWRVLTAPISGPTLPEDAKTF